MATIAIGKKTYELHPLTTGQIRRHAGPLLATIRDLANGQGNELDAIAALPDVVGAHVDLLHLALKGAYPHLTLEEVEDLTFPAIQAGVTALLQVSGLMGPAPGEAKAPAKATARR